MIIFLILIILIIKFKFHISLKIQNFNSCFELKFLWLKFDKKGKFVLKNTKRADKINSQEEILNFKAKKSNEKVGKKRIQTKKRKFTNALLKVLARNMHFEKLSISEKIGLYEPMATALSIPILSTLTNVPLQFLKVNYNNFRYKITPIYNEFEFYLDVNAKISFRLIDIISSIINEKMSKLFMRISL